VAIVWVDFVSQSIAIRCVVLFGYKCLFISILCFIRHAGNRRGGSGWRPWLFFAGAHLWLAKRRAPQLMIMSINRFPPPRFYFLLSDYLLQISAVSAAAQQRSRLGDGRGFAWMGLAVTDGWIAARGWRGGAGGVGVFVYNTLCSKVEFSCRFGVVSAND